MARAWDEGRRTGRWDKQHLSDEEERRIQTGIDECMRSVIADRHYDPVHALDKRLDGSHIPMATVTPVGAPVVKDLPSGPTVSEPWRPMHPVQDWLRLGSTVADANLKSAEAQLRQLGGEEKE
jgi:hypothetical protein